MYMKRGFIKRWAGALEASEEASVRVCNWSRSENRARRPRRRYHMPGPRFCAIRRLPM
jgi:hypothetical protein